MTQRLCGELSPPLPAEVTAVLRAVLVSVV